MIKYLLEVNWLKNNPSVTFNFHCHLHKDGSFHTVVDVSVEDEILEKQWGVRHIYYDRGVKEVLVYAPRNEGELAVAKKIITESYKYASGDLTFTF